MGCNIRTFADLSGNQGKNQLQSKGLAGCVRQLLEWRGLIRRDARTSEIAGRPNQVASIYGVQRDGNASRFCFLVNGHCAHFLFVAAEMDFAQVVETAVTGLGYELVDVERSNRGRMIRVFIDLTAAAAAAGSRKKSGAMISVEDCEKVSRQLTYVFTVENVDYDRLEISSPGLDRPLKKQSDFERFAGQEVMVKLRAALGGAHGIRKNFQGVAGSVNGKPAITVDGVVIELDWAQIDKARLVPVVDFKQA